MTDIFEIKCKNCIFHTESLDLTRCRRNPVPVIVNPNYWCGEFSQQSYCRECGRSVSFGLQSKYNVFGDVYCSEECVNKHRG